MYTVLLADGDERHMRVVANALRRSGFTVVTATDGLIALEQCRGRRVDAAVLSAELAILSPVEVLQSLRLSQEQPIAAWITTASYERGMAARGAIAGALLVVAKPFRAARLAAHVREELDRRNVDRKPIRKRSCSTRSEPRPKAVGNAGEFRRQQTAKSSAP